jgi:hypothetical protein
MVTVVGLDHLDRHSQRRGCFPGIDSGLHEPCRSRVPEGVRCHGIVEPGPDDCLRPCGVHLVDLLAEVVAQVSSLGTVKPLPAA